MYLLLIFRDRAPPLLVQRMSGRFLPNKGPDTGIARVEAAPCQRAQKQGNEFRRRSQLTNAEMGEMRLPRKPVTRIEPRTAVAGKA